MRGTPFSGICRAAKGGWRSMILIPIIAIDLRRSSVWFYFKVSIRSDWQSMLAKSSHALSPQDPTAPASPAAKPKKDNIHGISIPNTPPYPLNTSTTPSQPPSLLPAQTPNASLAPSNPTPLHHPSRTTAFTTASSSPPHAPSPSPSPRSTAISTASTSARGGWPGMRTSPTRTVSPPAPPAELVRGAAVLALLRDLVDGAHEPEPPRALAQRPKRTPPCPASGPARRRRTASAAAAAGEPAAAAPARPPSAPGPSRTRRRPPAARARGGGRCCHCACCWPSAGGRAPGLVGGAVDLYSRCSSPHLPSARGLNSRCRRSVRAASADDAEGAGRGAAGRRRRWRGIFWWRG